MLRARLPFLLVLAAGSARAQAPAPIDIEMDHHACPAATPGYVNCTVSAGSIASPGETTDGTCEIGGGVVAHGYDHTRAGSAWGSDTGCGHCCDHPSIPMACAHSGNAPSTLTIDGLAECAWDVAVCAPSGMGNAITATLDNGDDATTPISIISDPTAAGALTCSPDMCPSGALAMPSTVVRLHLDSVGRSSQWLLSALHLTPGDADGDGVVDCVGVDNCIGVANPDQADCDGDGVGDACSGGSCDCDGDGIPDRVPRGSTMPVDNCICATARTCSDPCWMGMANPDQADCDHDGHGDACDDDRDGDGVPNATDHCPDVNDPSNRDTDGDGFGDACDLDSNGDHMCDAMLADPHTRAIPAGPGVCPGATYLDSDSDGDMHAADDCDDCNAAMHPGAPEVCDGLDNDCNGTIDDGITPAPGAMCTRLPMSVCACQGMGTCLPDGTSGCACQGPYTPGQFREVCANGQDDDCDGMIDEAPCVTTAAACPPDCPLASPDGGTGEHVTVESGACCRVAGPANTTPWTALALLALAALARLRRRHP